MQGDGNFVAYKTGGIAIWHTDSATEGVMAALMLDGNLVVYDDRNNSVLWQSGTGGHPESYYPGQPCTLI